MITQLQVPVFIIRNGGLHWRHPPAWKHWRCSLLSTEYCLNVNTAGAWAQQPALSLIKERRFQRLNPPQHVHMLSSQTHNSCDLISHHLRGSRKSYLETKFGRSKKERQDTWYNIMQEEDKMAANTWEVTNKKQHHNYPNVIWKEDFLWYIIFSYN